MKSNVLYMNLIYENLYAELQKYEKNGIDLQIDGSLASPMQVVQAHMAKETGSYMRDYEMNAEGYIKTVSFTNINKKGEYDQSQSPK